MPPKKSVLKVKYRCRRVYEDGAGEYVFVKVSKGGQWVTQKKYIKKTKTKPRATKKLLREQELMRRSLYPKQTNTLYEKTFQPSKLQTSKLKDLDVNQFLLLSKGLINQMVSGNKVITADKIKQQIPNIDKLDFSDPSTYKLFQGLSDYNEDEVKSVPPESFPNIVALSNADDLNLEDNIEAAQSAQPLPNIEANESSVADGEGTSVNTVERSASSLDPNSEQDPDLNIQSDQDKTPSATESDLTEAVKSVAEASKSVADAAKSVADDASELQYEDDDVSRVGVGAKDYAKPASEVNEEIKQPEPVQLKPLDEIVDNLLGFTKKEYKEMVEADGPDAEKATGNPMIDMNLLITGQDEQNRRWSNFVNSLKYDGKRLAANYRNELTRRTLKGVPVTPNEQVVKFLRKANLSPGILSNPGIGLEEILIRAYEKIRTGLSGSGSGKQAKGSTESQLEDLVNDLNINKRTKFLGVMSNDELDDLDPYDITDGKAHTIIFNTVNRKNAGEYGHWCCVYIDLGDQKTIEIFDPLGFKPKQSVFDAFSKLFKAIPPNELDYIPKIKYNTIRLQRINSNTCGTHCISFLNTRSFAKNFKGAIIPGITKNEAIANYLQQFLMSQTKF